MTDRIHVTMNIDVFVEDETAMRDAAFERMRAAWSSEDDFPFESADDVPLGQVVHSLLADALPAELPGCRRSQLEVEADDADDADSSDDSDTDTPGSTASDTSEAEEGSDDQDDESEASNDDESATEDTSNNDEPETEDTSDNDDASSGDDDKKDS